MHRESKKGRRVIAARRQEEDKGRGERDGGVTGAGRYG